MSEAIFCKVCGDKIDEIKVAKAGPRHPPQHCSHACLVETQKREGHFARIGRLGNQAQQAFKAREGKIPEYEKRRDTVVASNKEKPRRSAKTQI